MKKALPPQQAREAAYWLIRYRARSVRELLAKLEAKGFDAQVIEQTIAWARSCGLVDDAKFAQLWVNDQLMRRPQGARRLRWELKNKGVCDEDIDQALSKAELDERELIRGLVEKRLALYRGQPWELQQRKLAAYLAHRGFAMQDIAAVLKEHKRTSSAS